MENKLIINLPDKWYWNFVIYVNERKKWLASAVQLTNNTPKIEFAYGKARNMAKIKLIRKLKNQKN